MAKLTLCDICGAVIKMGERKYILGVNEIEETGSDEETREDFLEFIRTYKQGFDRVQIFELCKECKKILEHLFKMRKKEREEAIKEITKLYEKKNGKKEKVE